MNIIPVQHSFHTPHTTTDHPTLTLTRTVRLCWSVVFRQTGLERLSVFQLVLEHEQPIFSSHSSAVKNYEHTPLISGRMPLSGKQPVLNLLTGQKSWFSPRRGDSLHRFTSNVAGPTGMWVRLAVQNFISVDAGVGKRPQNMKNFHFLAQSRLWPISKIYTSFIRTTIVH